MTGAPFSQVRGFSVVEIVVGAALVAVVVAAVSSAWQFYEKIAGQSARLAQADLLVEEGSEVLQYWRDEGWTANISSLALNTPYYVVWSRTDYIATTTPTTAYGTYARTVVFSPVYRDSSENIAPSGTVDPNTRLATITIYPSVGGGTAIMQAQTLVHNIFNN